MDVVDQVFLDLIADLQSMTTTDLWSPDRPLTLPARRLVAVRLVQVAMAAHESIPTPSSNPSDADLAKQWRRADDLITDALSWVPPGRAHHVWKTVQTYSRYVEHCELPYIAYLSTTCTFWEEAVEKIIKFVHAAEVVATLENADFDKYAEIEEEEPDTEFWEQLFHVTRLYVHPIDVPLVPAAAPPREFFKAKGALQKTRREAFALSGLIESTRKGKRWHPVPPEWMDDVKAELGLVGKARGMAPRSGGRPPKLTVAQLMQAEQRWPGADDASLGKKLGVHRSTVIRVRRLAKRSRHTRP